MMHLEADVFRKFDKQWALVTAGTPEHYNTMTISWGGLGTLWRRPVATVYVKKNRYTFEFMEQSDYFTVSFYPEEQRRALSLLGSTSGRDGDKIAAAGLHLAGDAGVPAPGHHLPPGGDHPGLPQALLPGLRPGPDPPGRSGHFLSGRAGPPDVHRRGGGHHRE